MKDTLPILYQDKYIVAVNKPAGLLVHRTRLDVHETMFALQMVRDMMGCYVYPLHRLDKPTSGVLLFALDKDSAAIISEFFRTGQIIKKYLAVVRGYTEESEVIDHPLREIYDGIVNPRKKEDLELESAVTEYRRLDYVELPYQVNRFPTSRYSLVEIIPHTGRRRQIRRHMKHISHPIIGDVKYGKGEYNRFFREHFDCHRLLLAAVEISFTHPWNNERLIIRAPLDSIFIQVLTELGWEGNLERDLIG